jgi:hypothetical protein
MFDCVKKRKRRHNVSIKYTRYLRLRRDAKLGYFIESLQ